MPTPRLTVDAVLKMAHAQAQRYAQEPLAAATHSPELRRAVAAVWRLVSVRLGPSDEAQALDAMIRTLTQPSDSRRGPRAE